MPRPEKIRLGEILVLQKLLSQEQLTFSLEEQKRSGRKLGRQVQSDRDTDDSADVGEP